MKTSDVILNGLQDNVDNAYLGKPKGYYDPSPVEVFFTRVGQEIFKFTDNNQHKTLMTDEDWITHCDTANKCVRFGTLYGPKDLEGFKSEELEIVRKFVETKKKWI
jgi:hypothetical protein